MSYLVIARKYRPQSFDEIVGQEHVTQTLKSAIAQGKVAHAYLFSGPRGVGKTSAARILAKSLNCEKGISADPCQKCTNCVEITQGSSLDVLEIDGASNRGIDEVRALRENVKFSPVHGRFKIYIIDEVHSLTHDAFNALLKTLEEPPAHVKFIFATTEAHRVLPTILSRCQRFDFKRIPVQLLVQKLSEIAKQEKIEIDTDSLNEIALSSQGGLRDAQTILDQLGAHSGKKIEKRTVQEILGLIEGEVLEQFVAFVAERNTVKLLNLVKHLEDRGADLGQLVNNLIQHCRNLMIYQAGVKDLSNVLDLPKEGIEKVRQQAGKLGKDETLFILHSLVGLQQEMKRAAFPKILLELALVRMTEMRQWIQIPELVEKLKELEAAVGNTPEGENGTGSVFSQQQPREKTEPVPNSPGSTDSPVSLEKIVQAWPLLAGKIKSQKVPLGTGLQTAKPSDLEGRRLVISFPSGESFHKEIAERPNNKKFLEQQVQQMFGISLMVEMVLESPKSGSPDSDGGREKAVPHTDHPLVKSALEIFGARVIRVQEEIKESNPNDE
ncbi:MAG: DNA polymerase III subunit gamma/tau [Candidatus Omnitrophica bacterium]|nr:DNA polymerase III subunit gamma/tau [Candidatus Omnitrophota bacterium]